jgi:cell division protein FtsL
MSPARGAAATARTRRHPAAAPPFPRRVSGPVRQPIRGGAIAVPAARPGRVGSLADRLVRSRALIWLIGLALMGIVAMQVSLLKMNAGISRAVETSTTLERQNAALEASIARLGSQERIRSAALELGMVSPSAGAVGYVTTRPGIDAGRAARRIQPPSDLARQVLDGGAAAAFAQLQAPVVQPQQQAPAVTGTP